MSFSDETLIAYADGELDAATRRVIEDAMRVDASLARRVARLRSQRSFASQPPPVRCGNVVQLAEVRAHRAAVQQAARKARPHRWGWIEWTALGTVLVLGLAAGRFGLSAWQPSWLGGSQPPPSQVLSRDGMLVAQGRLASALSQQMGGAVQADTDVRVGLSFLSNEGSYCRSFTLVGASQDLVGIACRASEEWRIPVLVKNVRPQPQEGGYQMASTEMPSALLEAIDQRIVGGMLDARAEMEALRRNWQR
jgi:hypothetical protein